MEVCPYWTVLTSAGLLLLQRVVGNAARAARTALWQGMEGCFQIPDEISVDKTMSHGLETVKMWHRCTSISCMATGFFVFLIYVLELLRRYNFPYQKFGKYSGKSQGETATEAWLRLITREGPPGILRYVSVAACRSDEVVIDSGTHFQ